MCAATAEQIPEYLEALPREEDVEQDARCGATGGAFTGMWVGSQVAAWINQYYRGMTLPKMLVWHVGLNQEVNKIKYTEGGGRRRRNAESIQSLFG